MKSKLGIYILVGLLLIGGAYWLTKSRQDDPIAVRTAEAKKGDIQGYISTNATIKSQNTRTYFGRQGKINEVHVKVGDKVESGNPLLSYDTQEFELAVNQAQIQYENALLQRQELDTQANSIQTAREGKGLPEEKIQQADNAVRLAKLNLDAAKERLNTLGGRVTADLDGIVTEVNVLAGGTANPAQPAIVIQDLESLKAVATVGKYDANEIRVGQEAKIISRERVYDGEVSFVEPVAKRSPGPTGGETTLTVEVEIKESNPDLTIDFDVETEILVAEANNVVKVPIESIKREKGDRNFVYIIDGDRAREREITPGLYSKDEVEVKKGVKVGERVILNPSASIVEGTLVKENVERLSHAEGK